MGPAMGFRNNWVAMLRAGDGHRGGAKGERGLRLGRCCSGMVENLKREGDGCQACGEVDEGGSVGVRRHDDVERGMAKELRAM